MSQDNVITFLKNRGFLDSFTNEEELIQHVMDRRCVYVGFDPTADSLHLGNLVGIIALRWFQKFGHTVVALMGGATAKIGDPSGKSAERPLLSEKQIQSNLSQIEKQFGQTLDSEALKLLNNDAWLSKWNLIDFLREVGKHFRMGPMLAKESVKSRLNSSEGMSFTEFTYQMMQGYDFHYLQEHEGVTVQLGGSDQWGNITAGIELARKLSQAECFGATFPLLTRSDGKKFGKSEGGAIWLSKEKCSPYAFYQYLFRIPDTDIIKMLKMLTFLSDEEIADDEHKLQSGELPPNTLQAKLAEEVTRYVHGEEGVESALAVTKALAPGSTVTLTKEIIEAVYEEMPHVEIEKDELLDKTYADVAKEAGLFDAKGEANRLLKNGGAYINNEKWTETTQKTSESDLISNTYLLIGAGKKKKMIIKAL